jgi:plasmid stabilization system protein ParE
MVEYSAEASEQLRNIAGDTKFNESARQRMIQTILDAAEDCEEHPYRWPEDVEPGTRRRSVRRTPFIIIYRITPAGIEVANVWHHKEGRGENR